MQVNNIIVPDAGTTKEYISDPIGGWMYVVTTTTEVEQQNLQQFKGNLADIKAQRDNLQALIDEIEPHAVSFEEAVEKVAPLELPAIEASATSTPAM